MISCRNHPNPSHARLSSPLLRVAVAMVLAITGAGTSTLAERPAYSLQENSPFLPPGFGQSEPTPESPGERPLARLLEFRSVVQLNNEWLFSIHDTRQEKSVWVSMNDASSPYHVLGFDDQDGRIQISYDGQTEWVALKSPQQSPRAASVPDARAGAPQRNAPSIDRREQSRPAIGRRPIPRRAVTVPERRPAPEENN